MSFALSWQPDEIQAGGFLLFDAVTSWNRSFSGNISEHPIDGGGSVTDHYSSVNPTFTLSAVISATDISTTSSLLGDEEGNSPYNTVPAPAEVLVSSTDQSLLMKFIPNVVGQFLPDQLPEVIMDDIRGDAFAGNTTEQIQDILVNLQSGEGINQITGQFETLIRPVSLYETDGFLTLIKKLPADDSRALVITGLNFREDTESGYALYVDLTFRLVRFANLKKVQLPPELVQAVVKKKATSKKSLGKCDSTQKDVNTSTSVKASKENTTGIFPI